MVQALSPGPDGVDDHKPMTEQGDRLTGHAVGIAVAIEGQLRLDNDRDPGLFVAYTLATGVSVPGATVMTLN